MTTMPQPTVIPTIALMETVIPWLLPPSVVGEADEEVSADVGEAWGSVRDVEVGIKDDDGDDDVMIGEDITGSPIAVEGQPIEYCVQGSTRQQPA